MSTSFPHTHLLGIEGLKPKEVTWLLDRAELHAKANHDGDRKKSTLKGTTVINLFYENSTRTRTSFEIAGKRLGADVINISTSASSAAKGESLIDTALTLCAMHPDVIVLRHNQSGAAHIIAQHTNCAVINAGDGCHQHPTQALLDALTIRRRKGTLKGLKIVICGDILHSRVARSNIQLLQLMGADVHLVAPPTLMPLDASSLGATLHTTIDSALPKADVIMMLRLQHERMQGRYIASVRDYFIRYGLDESRLAKAAKDALVLHPGPINRGVEISGEVADHITQSGILEQVEMGVAIRMTLLETLIDRRRNP